MPTFEGKDAGEQLSRWLVARTKVAGKAAAVSTVHRLVGIIQGEIIPGLGQPPVFEGVYRAGWHAEETEAGADVVNTVPHASVIEHGAKAENIKPGRAMVAALTEWVRRKGLGTPEEGQTAEQAVRSVVWAIIGAMRRRGIFNRDGQQGLGVARRAQKMVGKIYAEEFRAELKRALK